MLFLAWGFQKNLSMWIESGLQIKRSLGIQRGKSDPADAYEIAMYANRFEEKCTLARPPQESIQRISNFMTLRERHQKVINMYSVPMKENKKFLLKEQSKELEKGSNRTLNAAKRDLIYVEEQIHAIINENIEVKELYETITSVKGIGFVTAATLIALTDGFQKVTNARSLACYLGVAPFQHTSGTSIRGKTRVSHFANKTLKKLFHMAALSAMRNCEKMREYADKKLAEGKHIMSVINAIRNKLIHIICACVRKKQKYEKNYTRKLA